MAAPTEAPPGPPTEIREPAVPPTPAAEAPAALPRRRRNLRRILVPVLVVVVLIAASVGFNIYWQSAHYVSTDNAQVGGQPVPVGSMNAGRVTAVRVAVGDTVQQGQLLAQVELPTTVRQLQNGAPDLEFVGAADQRVNITAPLRGVVIAVPAAVGATVSQGQAIVTLLDPTQMWVTANIDENQMSRLKVGQDVEVHMDALNQTLPGTISQLTPATASVFGLLPQSNTTTNFTKVAQVVPIRIAVDMGEQPGLLGSSAEVKIHVA
ncbi:MAG: efflux RND transporter periplasmic adaptor subunit [Chloroflexi bacterium]|nr:efflux RND transporter periplasmic adaptor subunit [Chloroflexota bacterium]